MYFYSFELRKNYGMRNEIYLIFIINLHIYTFYILNKLNLYNENVVLFVY